MDEIRELLEEQIASSFGDLASLDVGSEEHARAVEDLTKLYRLRIDDAKTTAEKAEHAIERYLKYGAEFAGIALPLLFYAAWMRRGFKFEETGCFTSTTFKGLINRFRPTK